MRIGALLLVGLGFVFVAACSGAPYSADTSANGVCEAAGGTCLAVPDGASNPAGCGEQMTNATCDPGLVCCVLAATPAPDGSVVPAADGGATTSAAQTSSTGALGDAGSKG
jgi:hypothetical protein